MKGVVTIGLVLVLVAVTLAQPMQPAGASALDATVRALETTNRNLGRWFVVVVVALVLYSAVSAWRIWGYSRRLAELDDMRRNAEKRFDGMTDELLRAKRKLAEFESRFAELPAGPGVPGPSPNVARLEARLAELSNRLTQAEAKLEAVMDRSVAGSAVVPAELVAAVKAAEQARNVAEGAAARAESMVAAIQAREAEEAGAERPESRIQSLEPGVEGKKDAATAAESPADGDERFGAGDYAGALDAYTSWLGAKHADADPTVLFRVRHNRAVANLRLGRLMDALNDAAELEPLADAEPKARGAARLLAGVVHLNQGLVDEALLDFAAAMRVDPGARDVLAADEDIMAWMEVNPKAALRVKKALGRLTESRPGPGPGRGKRGRTRKA